MRSLIAGAAVVTALAFAAPAGAATIPVTALSGAFQATNPSVALTLDGVQFGPYSRGGRATGTLVYNGFNGRTLSAIQGLSYTAMYNTTDDKPVAAPYLRVWLDGNTHDVIFAPSTQPGMHQVGENVNHRYDVVAGTVRYDDDSGEGPDSPWAEIVGAHGSRVVSRITVSVGNSGGLDLSALLRDLSVNGDTFCFNCAPGIPGPPGPAGLPAPSTSLGPSGTPPAPGLQIRSARRDTSKGTVRLVLFCPKATGVCEGKVTIRADKQTVASKEFNQRGGAKFTLAVKLSSSARRRIANASKVEALILSRDTVGFATRVSRSLKR